MNSFHPKPINPLSCGGNGRSGSNALSTVVRQIDCGGFVFREHRADPNQKNPRHSHDYYCMGFVFGGEGGGEIGRNHWNCGPGTLNVIPAHTEHVEMCGPTGLQWCGIEMARMPEAVEREARVVFSRAHQVFGGAALSIAWRICSELRLGDGCSSLALHGLGLELLAALARSNGIERRPPAWLARAEEYARANFARPLQLEDIAAEAGVHPLHLARTFRKHLGCSVGEFLRARRLDAAIQLMSGGGRLSAVAQHAGFCDQAHLARTFKRHTGLSPTEYRRLHSR